MDKEAFPNTCSDKEALSELMIWYEFLKGNAGVGARVGLVYKVDVMHNANTTDYGGRGEIWLLFWAWDTFLVLNYWLAGESLSTHKNIERQLKGKT